MKRKHMTEKSLVKNAFYNVVYKCLNVLFPLVSIMYVSRVLLPTGVGKVASAQNIIAYFVILASLGLSRKLQNFVITRKNVVKYSQNSLLLMQ